MACNVSVVAGNVDCFPIAIYHFFLSKKKNKPISANTLPISQKTSFLNICVASYVQRSRFVPGSWKWPQRQGQPLSLPPFLPPGMWVGWAQVDSRLPLETRRRCRGVRCGCRAGSLLLGPFYREGSACLVHHRGAGGHRGRVPWTWNAFA